MLRFEWNALRTGDPVLVHDPRTAAMTVTGGVVASVDAHKGTNGVGIRVGSDSAVLWPSPLAVHRDPRDPTEPCWRCQELAGRAASPRGASPHSATAGAQDPGRPDPTFILSGVT
jgi:hypothetical protein